MFRKLLVGAIALAAVAQPAFAADPIKGVAALKEWNLIVLGDLKTGHEIEGRTFVGGGMSGAATNFYTRGNEIPASTQPGLTVVGNVNSPGFNQYQLQNKSGAWIGGNVSQPFDLHGVQTVKAGGSATGGTGNLNGSTFQTGLGASFTNGLVAQKNALVTSLGALSADLAALAPTASVGFASNGQQAVFNAAQAFNVFRIDGTSLLPGGKTFFDQVTEINFSAAGTTIVNVSGKNLVLGDNWVGSSNELLGEKVLWNFYEAETLTFSNTFLGSVLAPRATATTNNYIAGSVALSGLYMGGEIHRANFDGTIVSAPVPEPATWAMMIAGFGLVGGALRRRKSSAPAADEADRAVA